jgi:hypothetical protein
MRPQRHHEARREYSDVPKRDGSTVSGEPVEPRQPTSPQALGSLSEVKELDDIDEELLDQSIKNNMIEMECYQAVLGAIRGGAGQLPVFLGRIGRAQCQVLVDSGAQGNFISEAFVRSQGLRTHRPPKGLGLRVRMADGTPHDFDQVVKGARLGIGEQYKDDRWDLVVIPLRGFDVILGTPWLAEFKPLLDLEAGTAEFEDQYGAKILLPTEATSEESAFLSAIQVEKALRRNEPEEVWLAHVRYVAYPEEAPTSATDNNDGKRSSQPVLQMGPCSTQLINDTLTDFADLFVKGMPPSLPPQREVDHAIELQDNTQPISIPPYRVPLHYEDAMEQMIADLLARGFIHSSKSPFGAPVLFVKKKDGGLRMCWVDDLLDRINGATIFSSLDAASGYYQVRVKEGDVGKTAFHTPKGHYEFVVLPFGLTNAPATFQLMMNRIVQEHGLQHFVAVYLDDILVFSRSEEEHAEHLRRVLMALRRARIYLSAKKCQFAMAQVGFLGHLVSGSGIRPDPEKVRAL